MTAALSPIPTWQEFDDNGKPLAGAKLYCYEAGTVINKDTYTDQHGNTTQTNPIVFDAAGRSEVWLGSGMYHLVLKDSLDNVIWDVDNVSTAGGGGSGSMLIVNSLTELRALSPGAATVVLMLGYYGAGDGGHGYFTWNANSSASDDNGCLIRPSTMPASGRWVRMPCNQIDPVKFGAKADGTTDDSAAIIAANTYAVSKNIAVEFNRGNYNTSSNITFTAPISFNYGAKISGDSSITITVAKFNGDPNWVVFNGNMTILATSGSFNFTRPIWFGGTNSIGLYWACTVALAAKCNVKISGSVHTINSVIDCLYVPLEISEGAYLDSTEGLLNNVCVYGDPNYKILTGATNTKNTVVRPEWWGADANGDWTDAIKKACQTVQNSITGHGTKLLYNTGKIYSVFTKASFPTWADVLAADRILGSFTNLYGFECDFNGAMFTSDRDYEGDETKSWTLYVFGDGCSNINCHDLNVSYKALETVEPDHTKQAGFNLFKINKSGNNFKFDNIWSDGGVSALLTTDGTQTGEAVLYKKGVINNIEINNVNLTSHHKGVCLGFGTSNVSLNNCKSSKGFRALECFGAENVKGNFDIDQPQNNSVQLFSWYETGIGNGQAAGNEAVEIGVKGLDLKIKASGAMASSTGSIVYIRYIGNSQNSTNKGIFEDNNIEVTTESNLNCHSIFAMETDTANRGHIFKNNKFSGNIKGTCSYLFNSYGTLGSSDAVQNVSIGDLAFESLASTYSYLNILTPAMKSDGGIALKNVYTPNTAWTFTGNTKEIIVQNSNLNGDYYDQTGALVKTFTLTFTGFTGANQTMSVIGKLYSPFAIKSKQTVELNCDGFVGIAASNLAYLTSGIGSLPAVFTPTTNGRSIQALGIWASVVVLINPAGSMYISPVDTNYNPNYVSAGYSISWKNGVAMGLSQCILRYSLD